MNLKKLSMKELHELINTTSDIVLLSKAEQEYVNRTCISTELEEDTEFEDEL